MRAPLATLFGLARRQRPRHRALRRRRLRQQGRAVVRTWGSPCMAARAVPRPAGQAGAHAPADVLARRPPRADGPARRARRRPADGTLAAIRHDVLGETSRFDAVRRARPPGQPAAVRLPERGDHPPAGARSTCRPRRSRARPARRPASFALESAMDELADELGLESARAAVRKNHAEVDPERRQAVVAARTCSRATSDGAERVRLGRRAPTPRRRRDGGGLVGTGVARAGLRAATAMPGSGAIDARAGRELRCRPARRTSAPAPTRS